VLISIASSSWLSKTMNGSQLSLFLFIYFFSGVKGVKGEPGNTGPPGRDGLKGDTGETGTFQTREKVYICFYNPFIIHI